MIIIRKARYRYIQILHKSAPNHQYIIRTCKQVQKSYLLLYHFIFVLSTFFTTPSPSNKGIKLSETVPPSCTKAFSTPISTAKSSTSSYSLSVTFLFISDILKHFQAVCTDSLCSYKYHRRMCYTDI